MIIKRHQQKDTVGDILKVLKAKRFKPGIKFYLALVLMPVFATLSMLFALLLFNPNSYNRIMDQVANYRALPNVVFRNAMGQFATAPKITIDIKHVDFQQIAFDRDQKLNDIPVEFEYVPAKIRLGDETIKVKLRLKGDRKIHMEDIDKLSFRVRTRGDKLIFGMKKFSLQHPRARNYIHEWLYHTLLSEQGLVALNYMFVELTLNGKNLGTYVLEEHFSKQLVERQQRRNGPLIRFSEGAIIGHETSQIVPYDYDKWTAGEDLVIVQRATALLEGFRQNKLKLDDVFDSIKMARFFAVNDLLGTYHGGISKSIRFYYNPITGKLEPIGFDGHFGTMRDVVLSSELGQSEAKGRWIYTDFGPWMRKIFNNPETVSNTFYAEYVRTLNQLTQPEYLDNFFDKHEAELNQNLEYIYKGFPLVDNIFYFGPNPYYFDVQMIYDRQIILKERMSNITLNANLSEVTSELITINTNILVGTLPIEPLSLSCGTTTFSVSTTNLIYPTMKNTEEQNISFNSTNEQLAVLGDNTCLKLHYKVLGEDVIQEIDVLPWTSYDQLEIVKNDYLLSPKSRLIPSFVEVNGNNYNIPRGEWILTSDLIIPSNSVLTVAAGTSLYLDNNSMINSQSPVHFQGTEESPIYVGSTDGTGNGISLMNAYENSIWNYLKIDGLSNPKKTGWTIPGTISFHESPVEMLNVSFFNNKSEDFLNIVRSKFHIRSSHFENAFADAVDIDFGMGEFEDVTFINSGNDALDMSGSEIVAKNIVIEGAGDKGVSVGEDSQFSVNGLIVRNAEIAINSKDNSIARINNGNLSNSKIGLIVFQKKAEFGPGTIIVSNLLKNESDIPYLVEENSSIMIDDREIEASGTRLKDILYGAKFGKASD